MLQTELNLGDKKRPPAKRSGRSNRKDPNTELYAEVNRILAIILREWKLIAYPALAAVVLVIIYFMVMPEKYTATASILIDIQKPRIISSDAAVPGLDTTRYMIGPVIDSQVEILQSTRIAERVVRQTNLQNDPEYAGSVGASFVAEVVQAILNKVWPGGDAAQEGPAAQSPLTPPAAAASGTEADANPDALPPVVIGKFLQRLDVRRKGLTLIMLVRFTDENPVRAAEIANAAAKIYLDDQSESRLESARSTTIQLNFRVNELREQVLAAERRLQEYRAENDLVSVGGVTVSEREISETVSQLIVARTQAATRKAELQQIKSLSDNPGAVTSISQVLDSQVVRDLRRQEAEVNRRLATAVSQFGDNDIQAQAARAELNDVRRQLVQEIDRIIQNASNDYEIAVSRVKYLESDLKQLTEMFAKRNQLSITLGELEREANTTRDVYLSLLSRLKEVRVQESLLYPDARIIDLASPPRRPSGPGILVVLALAIFGTVGASITFLVLRDHMVGVLQARRKSRRRTRTRDKGETGPRPDVSAEMNEFGRRPD